MLEAAATAYANANNGLLPQDPWLSGGARRSQPRAKIPHQAPAERQNAGGTEGLPEVGNEMHLRWIFHVTNKRKNP